MLETARGRSDLEEGTPLGINVALAACVLTAAAFGAGFVPAPDPQWRCGVVAVVLAGFAAATVDLRTTAVIVGPTWMIVNGFLVDHTGDLSWHGTADLERLLMLAGAGLLGWGLGAGRRSLRRVRAGWQLDLAAAALAQEHRRVAAPVGAATRDPVFARNLARLPHRSARVS